VLNSATQSRTYGLSGFNLCSGPRTNISEGFALLAADCETTRKKLTFPLLSLLNPPCDYDYMKGKKEPYIPKMIIDSG